MSASRTRETVKKGRYQWLPTLITTSGCSISILLIYILRNNIQTLKHPEPWLPWLVGGTGVVISALLGLIATLTIQAQKRASVLHEMNETLKKEIDERARLEEGKLKLEESLMQGQKLQAMGTLAGGIAHDFNNILYAIKGYTEMAQEDSKALPLVIDNLGKVLAAAKRGQDLVNRILTFTRRQQQKNEQLRMHHVIETALQLLRPAIPSSVNIHYEYDGDPIIMGQPTHLHQVLVNLINNAVDAMDCDGEIRIYLKAKEHSEEGQDYCKVDISDTGHGIDQEKIKRVFEPFFTTKEVGKGTGLGLSIVHSIMEEHLGKISVKSEIGQGATFTLLLPIHKE